MLSQVMPYMPYKQQMMQFINQTATSSGSSSGGNPMQSGIFFWLIHTVQATSDGGLRIVLAVTTATTTADAYHVLDQSIWHDAGFYSYAPLGSHYKLRGRWGKRKI